MAGERLISVFELALGLFHMMEGGLERVATSLYALASRERIQSRLDLP